MLRRTPAGWDSLTEELVIVPRILQAQIASKAKRKDIENIDQLVEGYP